MASDHVVSTRSELKSFVLRAAFGAIVALLPAQALAQTAPSEPAAAAPPAAAPPPMAASAPMAEPAPAAAKSGPTVGGHVGLAVPLVSFHSGPGKTTQSVSDNLTLAVPIGISLHFSKEWTFDFETIVGNTIGGKVTDAPGSTHTGLTVDPGIVYTGGPVALGLRVKFDIGGLANVGVIPLVNYGLVPFNGGVWFIEAAFPITVADLPNPAGKDTSLAIVLHTGIGF
jgi:hypothetical protein